MSDWSLSIHTFNWIRKNLKQGTILELGSGAGSHRLSKHYTVYSVEHDEKWLNKYNTNYIYAPIIDGWYDPSFLDDLPRYDLLIIDGPPGVIGREGILKHLDKFQTDIPIILDDTNREAEKALALQISKYLNRKGETLNAGAKSFTVF